MMFPPWVWYRLIFLMENACLNFQCYQLDDMFGVRYRTRMAFGVDT